VQKLRFNDTLKISLDERDEEKLVTLMELQENSPLPLSRTYHAACLVDKYMVISGGEASADMQDMWALDLD
jgi:hypothetical protein